MQDGVPGTGLGPRAYAIIGQGTISRIIESKPEELRLFLEEAAGVSKYKERRRETESRLSDTRENLTRVEDILRELTANLDRLEQQAVGARQDRDLQDTHGTRQGLLWMLRANGARALAAGPRRAGTNAHVAHPAAPHGATPRTRPPERPTTLNLLAETALVLLRESREVGPSKEA